MQRDDFDAHLDRILIGGREPQCIELQSYQETWPGRFAQERDRIAGALGNDVETIEHIGSTAVPGLEAKPIIDILVAVPNPRSSSLQAALERAGYVLRVSEPSHRMFRTPACDVHVHVWAISDPEVRRHLAFRDRLRASTADRDAYARLKRQLATRDWADLNHYSEAKGPLIEAILERANRRGAESSTSTVS